NTPTPGTDGGTDGGTTDPEPVKKTLQAKAVQHSLKEDMPKVISFPYQGSAVATACALTKVKNVTVVKPCKCSAGQCQVEVKGTAEFSGTASFAFTLKGDKLESTAEATL